MKQKRHRKLPVWMPPVFTITLVISGYIFFDNYNMQNKLRDEILLTDEALEKLYLIRVLQSDTESEEQRFLLTGDSLYWNKYHSEKTKLQEGLEEWLTNNRELFQIKEAKSLENRIRDWMALSEKSISRFKPGIGSYTEQAENMQRRTSMQDEFKVVETLLLMKRKESSARMKKLTTQNTFGFVAVMLLAAGMIIAAVRLNTSQLKLQHKAELDKKDEDIKAAFEYAYIGKALVSPEGKFLLVNRSLSKMLGYPEAELLKLTFQDITYPDDLNTDIGNVTLMLQRKIDSYEMEKRYITKAGNIIWALLSVSIVWNEDGSPRYFVSQVKDISGEKKIKKQLADSNEELEQFAYTASHDMKEPIRMIGSFMALLEKNYGSRLDDTAKKYIHFATDGANRMNKLINDLLEYSRAGRTGSTPGPINVDELLNEIVQFNKAVIETKNAVITWSPMPEIHFSRTALQQVFQNLIGNALKYQTETATPRVEITATVHDYYWQFTVSDNGIGFDPADKDKIFALFQRLHGKSEFPGSGIGLATCKKIIDKSGGTIWCDSTPGKGSVFHFSILKQLNE